VTYPTLVHEAPLVSRTPARRAAPIWLALIVLGSMFIGQQVATGGPMLRITIALVAMLVFVVPAFERPKAAVTGLFILLPFLGLVRRSFLPSTGVAALDPLLLITSAVAVTVLVALLLAGKLDFEGTTTSKCVFLLLCVGLLQVFNPGQGSLLVGFTGIMINLIPISFFFIARSISDQEMTARIVKIVTAIGVLAALYGLKQVFFGFSSIDTIGQPGYTAAQVGDTTRPFAFFTNSSEFAAYGIIAFCMVFAAFLFRPHGGRRLWPLLAAATITYAGFLTGSRGFTVKVGLAIIVLLALRARNRLLAAGIVIMLTSLVVGWAATSSSDDTIQEKKQGAEQLIEQQLRALRDPFDRSKSTLPIHWDSATQGVWYGITEHPAGMGTGVATRGGAKFKGIQAGTEFDVGDAFLALGIPGGILFICTIFFGIRGASRVRRAMPGPVWIAVYAMAIVSIGAWLVGGNYSVTPLIWFLIGAADGMEKRLSRRHLLEGDVAPVSLPA
jgi:hypothetical protein